MMKNAVNIQYQLASLSVFKGIMTRSVPRAYYRLLCSLRRPPDEFLESYGSFVSLLSERGCADRLAYSLTEAALFDENCFTRAAAGGTYRELSPVVLGAVRRDCDAILAAARLTAGEVLEAYEYRDEISGIAGTLPRWECGECAEGFALMDGSLDGIAAYYRKNGCGMFARYRAFIWRDGDIRPVLNYDPIDLDSFTGYERLQLAVKVVAPDSGENILAAHGLAGVFHKQLHQHVLDLGKLQALAVLFKSAIAGVEQEGTALYLGAALLVLVDAQTADECVHAGNKLGRGEGLCDIVVSAGHKAGDLVNLLILGGEHDDAHLGAGGADTAADLETVNIGQHNVKQSKADAGIDLQLLQCLLTVFGLDRLKAVAAQIDDHKAADIGFVFKNKNFLHVY